MSYFFLPYFWGYFVEACSFSVFNFSKYFIVLHCPSLMSSWQLINFVVGLFVTFQDVFKKILEMFFPYLYLFFLVGSFKFCSQGALPFAHFIYCQPCYLWFCIFNWVSYFIDLTLNVFFYSFWYVLVNSLFPFLSFCTLAFVGFLLLHKDTVFSLSCFFFTASVSH